MPARRAAAQARGRLAHGDDHGMGRGVAAAADGLAAVRHHRLVQHRDRAVGALAGAGGLGGLGERGSHVQLVVHGRVWLILVLGRRVLRAAHRSGRTEAVPSSCATIIGPRDRPPHRCGLGAGPAQRGIFERHGKEPPDRHPHRGRRRPRPQQRHQERHLPGHRARLRGRRHPARLGGPDPPDARRRARTSATSCPLDRINTRTIDRTGGTWLHSSRTNPRKMKTAAAAAAPRRQRGPSRCAIGEDRYDITPVVLENIERHGPRLPGPHRRRRHAELRAGPARQRRAAHRHPQDHGQRRPGHGVLHRLLHAPSRGPRTPSTASARRSARTSASASSASSAGTAGFTALYTAFVTSARCLIPEVAVRHRPAGHLMAERPRLNPSHYAFVIAAEGAIWEGGSIAEVGEPDAFGHRHKANVAEVLAAELKSRTGIETIHSDLTYDLRSGEPDSVDQMVAHHLRQRGHGARRGRPARPHDGHPRRRATRTRRCPTRSSARVSVDVDAMYNRERFRPVYSGPAGPATPARPRRGAARGVDRMPGRP